MLLNMIGPKAYIHINRLKKNINNIKKTIGNRNLMLVVKANGYGHGGLNIAKNLSGESNIIFCVFTIDEAISLRNDGIKKPIFIFSRIHKEWIEVAYENNLWVNVSHIDDLLLLNSLYKEKNICPDFHLKFDTGMTRLGFDYKDYKDVFNYLLKHPFLPVKGIYSHFATADEGDLSYANNQIKLFNKIISSGEKKGLLFKYIHCSNSGSILNLSDSLYNTVRVGILAYGVSPSDEVTMKINVEPVMSFCSPIINIRRVSENTQISYGGIYKTKKATNIGVLQTGFADGLPRAWYEQGYISYKGNYFRIAGRICMDQFMVDFGDTKPNLDDEVLIFGRKDENHLSVELIAEKIKTTTYVLLTGIQGRTERIIV